MIEIRQDGDTELDLGRVDAGADDGDGDPILLTIVNTGPDRVEDVDIELEGDDASLVQVAADVDGRPGSWSEAGEGVRVCSAIDASESHDFWARALSDGSLGLGVKSFKFVVNYVAVGASE